MKKVALFSMVFWLFILCAQAQSGSIAGKVTEAETGEPVLFAAVALYNNGVVIKGTETDFDGNYQFTSLAAGWYALEVSYLGLATLRIDSISVEANTVAKVNASLESEGVLLEVVQVSAYKVPLVEQDNTTSGGTLTGDQIRSLPTRKVKGRAASVAGATNSSSGDHVNVRGSRDQSTSYYVDGVRVTGRPGNHAPPTQVPAPPVGSANEFGKRTENAFVAADRQAFSTFGVDVDRASYSIVRSYLQRDQIPPAAAVRTEEMVNYFEYDYLQPADEHPFAVHSELAVCPWNAEHLLLSVALQGEQKDLVELPPSNLTFLLDVSGSMGASNKLPLVKESILFLLDRLRPEDQVALVVYAGAAGTVLPPTKVAQKQEIVAALERLQAGGSTAGAQGILLAYELARKHFITAGNNRVILATDGDFNVGVSSVDALETLVEQEKESGVFLTTLGFGFGNLKDNRLERLADKGNGMYAYIDTREEAHKVFGEELTGSLYTIAKDVKLQLEFDSEAITSYRLIGYENRLLAKEDFDDDTKDAGEIGAGHSVTALYELVPRVLDQKNLVLGRLELRYKQPDEAQSQLLVHELTRDIRSVEETSCNYRWASAIASYSLILQDSEHVGSANLQLVEDLANGALGDDPYGIRRAFLNQLATTVEIMGRTGQN